MRTTLRRQAKHMNEARKKAFNGDFGHSNPTKGVFGGNVGV